MANEIKLSNAGPMITPHKLHAKSTATEDKPAATSAVSTGDRVSVTDTFSRLQEIGGELSTQPEINYEKVAAIKKSLADGTFSLDPERVADKLINFESSRTI